MTTKNNKTVGVLLLIFVSIGLLIFLQSQPTVIASGIIKNVKVFANGEQIGIFELPQVLTEEQQTALNEFAIAEFFTDAFIPQDYEDTAERQITGQRDLTSEQELTPQQVEDLSELELQTLQAEQSGVIQDVKTSQLVASRTSTNLIESSVDENTHIRGSILKVAGKIEMNIKQPPYFYNVHLTCCGMNTFRVISSVETDGQGNFIVKMATTPKWPLGQWIMTIATIGDDNSIIKHQYLFNLVEGQTRE